MRTCSGCGSIDSDRGDVCGICGRSLAGVASKSLEEAESEAESRSKQSLATRSKRSVSRSGLFVLAGGLAMFVAGVSLAALTRFGSLGFLLIVPGIFLTVVGIALITGDNEAPKSPSVWNRLEESGPPTSPGKRR